MQKFVVFNHSLLKTAGGAMPIFGYSRPSLERYRLS